MEILTNNKDVFHIKIYVAAGSIYEDPAVAGISHVLEHMMLKRCKKFNEEKLLKALAVIGGIYNATTSNDVTVYYANTHIDNYKHLLHIFHQCIMTPVFKPDELEIEKKIVLQEISGFYDNGGTLYNEVRKCILHSKNPYAALVEGSAETIKRITVNDLTKYYKERYSSMSIIVNCPARVKSTIQRIIPKLFPIKYLTCDSPEIVLNSQRFSPSIKVIKKDGLHQSSIKFIFVSFAKSQIRENTIFGFIRFALVSSGLYSILMYELRLKHGLIYSIESENECFRYMGLFKISISSSSGKSKLIIKKTKAILDKICKYGLSDTLLNFYKKSYINMMKYLFTDDEFLTKMYGEHRFYGLTDMSHTAVFDIITSITNKDVTQIATQVFSKYGQLFIN